MGGGGNDNCELVAVDRIVRQHNGLPNLKFKS